MKKGRKTPKDRIFLINLILPTCLLHCLPLEILGSWDGTGTEWTSGTVETAESVDPLIETVVSLEKPGKPFYRKKI